MRKLYQSRILYPIFILACVIVLGFIIALIKFNTVDKAPEYSESSIELLYDGASDGLTPRGDKFSISSISSDEVLSQAIDSSGINVSVEELRKNLVANGVFPEDIIANLTSYESILSNSSLKSLKKDTYFPTVFDIHLYNGFYDEASGKTIELSEKDLNKLLNSVMKTFYNYIFGVYVYKYDDTNYLNVLSRDANATKEDLNAEFDSLDYLKQCNLLRVMVLQILKYSESLYESNPLFQYNTQNFRDISTACSAINISLIEQTMIMILNNGISKDREFMKNNYILVKKGLEYDKAEQESNLTNINNIIDNYNRDKKIYIVTSNNATLIPANSSATYEALNEEKKTIAFDLNEITTDIEKYTRYISYYSTPVAGSIEIEVQNYIEETKEELEKLQLEFTNMLTAFNGTQVSESKVYKTETIYSKQKLISSGFIVECIKCIGPFGVIAVLYLLGREMALTKKDIKKKENLN